MPKNANFILLITLSLLLLDPIPVKAGFRISTLGTAGLTQMKGSTFARNVGQYSAGLWVSFEILDALRIGVVSEYRLLREFNKTSDGVSLDATRFIPISPAISLRFGNFTTYFEKQFYGPLNFSYPATGGKKVSYGQVSGWRLAELYRLFSGCNLGAFFERVEFGEVTVGSGRAVVARVPLRSQNFGLMLAVDLL